MTSKIELQYGSRLCWPLLMQRKYKSRLVRWAIKTISHSYTADSCSIWTELWGKIININVLLNLYVTIMNQVQTSSKCLAIFNENILSNLHKSSISYNKKIRVAESETSVFHLSFCFYFTCKVTPSCSGGMAGCKLYISRNRRNYGILHVESNGCTVTGSESATHWLAKPNQSRITWANQCLW